MCPLLIPSVDVRLRAASVFVSVEMTFKVLDFFRHWSRGTNSPELRDYYRFLIPFPVFSTVFPNHKRRIARPESPWPQVLRVCGGFAGIIIAVEAIRSLSAIALVKSNFVLNHVVMLPAYLLAVESLSRATYGLERMAGFDTIPIIRNVYLSRTVSEFWQRYNYRVHDWLHRNVFQATGGRHTPIRSILLVYLFSGLFHELAFTLATSRPTGYQFAFFTIQGVGALGSRTLDSFARQSGIAGRVIAHGFTIVFIAATSILFFHGVSKIFPFIYANPSPLP
jgi:hypothetical protein